MASQLSKSSVEHLQDAIHRCPTSQPTGPKVLHNIRQMVLMLPLTGVISEVTRL